MILTIFYAAATLDAIAFSMYITVATPYVYSLGGTQFFLGILGSTCAFISLIWNPIVGSLSDNVGRKKVLLYCLFICFIGNFLLICSSSLTIYFISRILAGLGTQIATLLKSLIDDNISSKDQKMSAISKIQALSSLSFIIGPIISGHLSEYENGVKHVFSIMTIIFAVNFGVILCLVKDKKVQSVQKTQQSINIFKEITLAAKNLTNINWPKYWDLFVIKLTVDFVLSVFYFNVHLILTKRLEMVGKSFGYVVASMNVIGITLSLTMMKLKKYLFSKDESGFSRLLIGNILLITAFAGASISSSFSIFILFLVPLSISRVLMDTTMTEVLLSRAAPQEKGSIMGTFDNTLSLAGLIAPLVSGIITDTWGESICLQCCTIPLILGAVITYSQKVKTN